MSALVMESKPKQRHTMTSFSVSDILGNADLNPRSRDPREAPTDVTAWQQITDPEMTSPATHSAMVNKVQAGTGSLQWLQVLQQHPTCEYLRVQYDTLLSASVTT